LPKKGRFGCQDDKLLNGRENKFPSIGVLSQKSGKNRSKLQRLDFLFLGRVLKSLTE
jgi:hypothetical protein